MIYRIKNDIEKALKKVLTKSYTSQSKSNKITIMKKLICYLSILSLMFMASSCSSTKKDAIKESFKKYVSTNFDNPKSLKEIVEINALDTITHEDFLEILEIFDAEDSLLNQIDSIYEIRNDELRTIMINSNVNKYDAYDRAQISNLLRESIDILNEENDFIKYELYKQERLRTDLDSLINNLSDIIIYSYEIKTRIDNKGELKLKSYYALEDNIRNEIIILDHKPVFDDYPQQARDFYETGKKYENIQHKYNSIIEKHIDNYERLKSFF